MTWNGGGDNLPPCRVGDCPALATRGIFCPVHYDEWLRANRVEFMEMVKRGQVNARGFTPEEWDAYLRRQLPLFDGLKD